MYNNKNLLYIVSAIASCKKVKLYSDNFNNSIVFLEADNQVYFNATITLLIAIGEKIKKIDNKLLRTQPDIQWQNIIDMRNILAHDYRGVDDEIVFKVVKVEVPILINALTQFLSLFPKKRLSKY